MTTTSGTINAVIWVTPSVVGTFQFSVQGFDAMGNASNTLTASFTVTP